MSDLYYDPDDRDDIVRTTAAEHYEASDKFDDDAWDWALNEQPTVITSFVRQAYRESADYATAVEDIVDDIIDRRRTL